MQHSDLLGGYSILAYAARHDGYRTRPWPGDSPIPEEDAPSVEATIYASSTYITNRFTINARYAPSESAPTDFVAASCGLGIVELYV